VKEEEYGGIIPEYAAVIFDEAHEIEDVAGQYFGLSVSNHQIADLRRDIAALARRKGFGSAGLDVACWRWTTTPRASSPSSGKWRDGPVSRTGRLRRAPRAEYESLLRALEMAGTQLELADDPPEEAIPLFQRSRDLANKLKFWMAGGEPAYVYWLERRGRGCYLQATPIDVSSILAGRLFEQVDTVILTSATLAVAGSFDYTRQRLGLRQARTLIVPATSTTPGRRCSTSPAPSDPRNGAFTREGAAEIVRILEASRGRAFVLFTSYQQMRLIYDRVSVDVGYPTLLQGTAPRTALLDEFRNTPHAVLLPLPRSGRAWMFG